jgi:hypothetical protein
VKVSRGWREWIQRCMERMEKAELRSGERSRLISDLLLPVTGNSPELGTDLVTTLAGLEVNNLAH